MKDSEVDEAMRERYERKEAERAAAEARYQEAREQAAELEVERAKLEGYTPKQFAPWFFAFLVEAKPCVYCANPTTADLSSGPFPKFWRANFNAQRERAGIRLLSHWHDNNFPVCVDCKTSDAYFECSHCKKTHLLSASHSQYGMPAEHLCVPCYETVPAKQWEGLVAELEEQHKYDFE